MVPGLVGVQDVDQASVARSAQIIQFIQTIKQQLNGYVADDFLRYLLRKVKKGAKRVMSSFVLQQSDGSRGLEDLFAGSLDIKHIIIKLSMRQSESKPEILSKQELSDALVEEAGSAVAHACALVRAHAFSVGEVLWFDLYFQILLKISQKQESGLEIINRLAVMRQQLFEACLDALLVRLISWFAVPRRERLDLAVDIICQVVILTKYYFEQSSLPCQATSLQLNNSSFTTSSGNLTSLSGVTARDSGPQSPEQFLLAALRRQIAALSEEATFRIEGANEKQEAIVLEKFASLSLGLGANAHPLDRQVFVVKQLCGFGSCPSQVVKEFSEQFLALLASYDAIKGRVSSVETGVLHFFNSCCKLQVAPFVGCGIDFRDTIFQSALFALEKSDKVEDFLAAANQVAGLFEDVPVTLEQCSKISKSFEVSVQRINGPRKSR